MEYVKEKVLPNKSYPFSVRLSEEDAAFIAENPFAEAKTPSDKIRKIITETRKQHEANPTYFDQRQLFESRFKKTVDQIQTIERETGNESQLLHFAANWLVDMCAEFASVPETESDLAKLEERVSHKIETIMEFSLRLAVTQEAPCVVPTVMKKNTKRIVELVRLLELNEEKNND